MRIVALLVLVLLAGCGFTLRGSGQLQLPVSLTLEAAEPGGSLARLLANTLTSAGVTLGQTGPVLSVGPEQQEIRPVSVTGRASAAQYQLTSSAQIMLSDESGVLLEPELISVQKTYYEDISNIAGSDDEIMLLRTEMRQELSEHVLRRLQALASAQAGS